MTAAAPAPVVPMLAPGKAPSLEAINMTKRFGAMTALVLAAVMCAVATGLLLMIGHSALVPGAVERSGGILEAFLLPFLIVLPGGVDAWIGASLAMWPQISRRLGAD